MNRQIDYRILTQAYLILTGWLFFSVVPFGTKNKFSMPCNVTLYGLPMFEQACKDALRRRGYNLQSNTNNKYAIEIYFYCD